MGANLGRIVLSHHAPQCSSNGISPQVGGWRAGIRHSLGVRRRFPSRRGGSSCSGIRSGEQSVRWAAIPCNSREPVTNPSAHQEDKLVHPETSTMDASTHHLPEGVRITEPRALESGPGIADESGDQRDVLTPSEAGMSSSGVSSSVGVASSLDEGFSRGTVMPVRLAHRALAGRSNWCSHWAR